MPILLLLGLGALAFVLASKGQASQPNTTPLHLPPNQIAQNVSSCPQLDPGIPQRLGTAVCVALANETSAATLRNFASALTAQYPVSANLLNAKAAKLGGK